MAMAVGDSADRLRIKSPKLLLVEGQSEYRFFGFLLEKLNAAATIQVANYRGKDSLKRFLRMLRVSPEYPALESIGVTRDADVSSDRAFQSVCGLLGSAGLDAPVAPMILTRGKPRVAVYVLPDCASPGTLETLCLSAVESDPAMPCVDEFLRCLEDTTHMPSKNPDKARAHTFLASRARPELRVGEAAEAGHWRLDSPVYNPLKRFLQAL